MTDKFDPSIYDGHWTNPDPVLSSESHLWIAVVMQGVIDAASTNKELREEIRDWVGTEDYDTVIELSGMNPITVRAKFDEILREKTHRGAFKKAMKFRYAVKAYLTRVGGISKQDKDDV